MEELNPIVCRGHEELRDIALGTRNDVKHLSETLKEFMEKIDCHEDRLRYLEINGAKISQENAANLIKMNDRVVDLEEFESGHKAAQKEVGKVAVIISGVISITGVIIGIIVTFWFWGKP